MEGNTIIGMAGGFIALAIMLGIGTLILGGSVTDCTTITGWNATAPNSTSAESQYDSSVTTQTGWALQCQVNNANSQSGYGLIMVSLIVLAAAVVLIVVRMLSG